MNYWIITDTHFNHKQLIEYWRPIDFEEKIKKSLIANIKKWDILIHLWDVCIWNDKENNNWFKNLWSKNILVKWNHDKKSNNRYLENWWDFVCKRFDINLYWKLISFTHIPIAWDWYFDINFHWHFHNTDWRRHWDFSKILSWYNRLIAVEYTNYNPITLKSLIK